MVIYSLLQCRFLQLLFEKYYIALPLKNCILLINLGPQHITLIVLFLNSVLELVPHFYKVLADVFVLTSQFSLILARQFRIDMVRHSQMIEKFTLQLRDIFLCFVEAMFLLVAHSGFV